MPSTVVRDAVHDLVELEPVEWDVVDTPAFQRLRRVRQLALTHYVYPGALHTRFEHCIGACHIAGKVGMAVTASSDDLRRVRLAALVHDIGHGPFSHVSEQVFEELAADEHPDGHIHEKVSAAIVRHHLPIASAIGTETAEWIADLLSGQGHARVRSVWRDVVAGPADVDKLDYLLRDSHYCGVNYGRYDLGKLTESAVRIPDARQSYLGFNEDGIYALEEMLLARHHMHRQVYGHKTRVATDLMLRRAMRDAALNGPLPLQVFKPSAEMDGGFVDEYLRWDDRRVLDTISDEGDGVHRKIAEDLRHRRLVKRLAVLPPDVLTDHAGGRGHASYLLSKDFEGDTQAVANAEAAIAGIIGVPAYEVYLHWRRLGDPLGRPSRAGVSAKDILLVSDDGTDLEFHESSEVFGSVNVNPTKDSLVVYCSPPEDAGEDPDALRQRVCDAACDALRQVSEPV